MYRPRVFKQRGSLVYRGRYRLSDGPRIYDVPLHTHLKHVAEAKLKQLVREKEEELAGLLLPKPLRTAAQKPLVEHLADFIADLKQRERCRDHVRHTHDRLTRLFADCHWTLCRDVSADAFIGWRDNQSGLSAKTLNEYLGHAMALFNWLDRKGLITHNPLKGVSKLPTAGRETFQRRALSFEEFVRFIRGCNRRRLLAYFVACCTGMRRGEMKQLAWSDLDLDADQPRILLRPETTKNKKGGRIPLVPFLADLLRLEKAKGVDHSGRVFPRGLPSVGTLAKDLVACGITVEDERGYRVDFHALRHTFVSLLAHAKVSELVRVKLARHGEWKQTDRYTDEKSIPLADGIAQLAALLPSLLASPKSGKTCPNPGNGDQTDAPQSVADIVPIALESAILSKAVPSWDSPDLVPEGGLEPPCG